MIRYVLAAIIAVAIIAISLPAIEYAAGLNGERTVESNLAAIDRAATSLVANEELPPPGQPGAQRRVTITLPPDSMTSAPIEHFELERVHENVTLATYRVEGRAEKTSYIDAPIGKSIGDTVEFRGSGVEETLVLHLERDPDTDRPVVVITRV